MWKRIPFNRDPKDTLYSELRKEFDKYFVTAGSIGKRLAGTYPRFFFGCMVILIVLSLVLSFTLFRHPGQKQISVVEKVNPVRDGFKRIIQATGKIRETIALKKLVDSLTVKRELSQEDSALLDSALDDLSKIHQTLK